MFLHTVKKPGSASSPGLFQRKLIATAVAAVSLSLSTGASAFSIDTGNPDLRLSWDNTVKYSAAWRLNDQESEVLAAYNPNLDDGDRNFNKGLISNRVDLYSQLDLNYKKQFGLRVTGAAWYDDVYHQDTDSGPGAPAGAPVPPGFPNNNLGGGPSQFDDETVTLHGGDSELLDAFIYGNMDIGEQGLSVKAGRYAQIYGTSLFFGGNGIAAAQAPIDIVKLLSVPGSTFQEIIRPVGQVGGTFIYSSNVSLSAYYQYEWERSVLPGAGSYFSVADFIDDGGRNIFGPPAVGLLTRLDDIEPGDTGQFGAAISVNTGDYDLGFYAAQYHDKLPQYYWRPGPGGGYALVYGEDIKTVGASISTSFTDTNIAAELSFREDMPLAGVGNTVVDATRIGDGGKNALYPVGNTVHAQISAISVLNENALWDAATLLGEIAYNRISSVEKNEDQLDPNTTRSASAMRLLFTPEFFQVTSGLDLSVPMGLGYGLSGNTAIGGTGFSAEGTGDVSIGLNFNYKRVWQGGIQLTHYYGDGGGVVNNLGQLSGDQVYADRDFISINVKRSF